MEPILLTTYHPDDIYSYPHFFILNQGMNAGKPSPYSAANTYVSISKNRVQKERYYWSCYWLWHNNSFLKLLKENDNGIIPLEIMKQAIYDFIINLKISDTAWETIIERLRKMGMREKQFHLNNDLTKGGRDLGQYYHFKRY